MFELLSVTIYNEGEETEMLCMKEQKFYIYLIAMKEQSCYIALWNLKIGSWYKGDLRTVLMN